jgi:hypothetical protein
VVEIEDDEKFIAVPAISGSHGWKLSVLKSREEAGNWSLWFGAYLAR